MRARFVAGSLLIVLGVLLLGVNRLDVGGDIVVLIVGSAFLVWFAFTRLYGLLIPGAIMTGLGLGIIADELGYQTGIPVLLGLGLGFCAIYVVDRLMGSRRSGGWWPLIPGGILTLMSLDNTPILDVVDEWWPLALVVAGLAILLGRSKSAGSGSSDSSTNPTDL